MSKKRRQKIDKIKNDKSLSDLQKEIKIKEVMQDVSDSTQLKRSQVEDFKDQQNYVTNERDPN
jgi:hypothetical protein